MRTSILLLILIAAMPFRLHAQEPPLTLREATAIARERNPMLRAARSAVGAAAARESPAGLPPDPEIQLGIMNASLPGMRTDMPGAMLPSVQIMQMLPFPGKRRLHAEIARQSTAIIETGADETWWDIRSRTAMSFYEVYRADRQIAVMEETLHWLRQFEEVATSMYSVGSGRQSDVLRAAVEVARMQAELARMRAMRAVAVARLNALLDRPASVAIESVELSPLPAVLPGAADLQQLAEESRPLLQGGRLGETQARSRERLARRELWPDVTLGLQYGQRPGVMGTERMGSVMVGFTVPVFASRRQMPMRREAAAMTGMASAELAGARALVMADIAESLAELERARTLIGLYRSEVLPQAEANVISAFASYRVGRVDFLTLVDAQMMLNRYREELYALLAEYGWRIAELEQTIGRELPAADTTLEEVA